MTALTWYLLIVVVVSGAVFVHGGRSAAAAVGDRRSPLLPAYAAGVAALSALAVLWHLGWRQAGAHPGSATAADRLEHAGFYTAQGWALELRADDTARAVRLPALRPGESLSLTPVGDGEGRAVRWRLEAAARALPLRIGGACVNLPSTSWLQSGDELVVEDRSGHAYAAVQWTRDPGGGGERWQFNQGTVQGGRRRPDFSVPVPLGERPVQEWARLSVMAQSKLPRTFTELARGGAESLAPWWRRLLRLGGGERPTLAPGVELDGVKQRYRRLSPLFAGVLWVRRDLGNLASPIGVFLDPEKLAGARTSIAGGGAGRPLDPEATAGGRVSMDLPGGALVRYGLGGAEAAALVLGERRAYDRELGLVVDLRFESPPSWPLPDRPDERFMIFSQDVQLPVVGFQIDGGLDREPFYAKARYLPGRDAFEVNDGKQLLGEAAGRSGAPPSVRLGEPFRLGSPRRGVVLRFQRPASPVDWPGPAAAAALLVAAALAAWELAGDGIVRPRLDLAWALLWGITVALLTVRVLLAYRAAVLPPPDATAPEVHNIFQKSFRLALIGLWIPSGLVAVRWLARGPQQARQWRWRLEDFGSWLAATRMAGEVRRRARAGAAWLDGPAAARPWLRWLREAGAALPPGLAAAAAILGLWLLAGFRRDSLLGMRVNIVSHLLIVAVLALAAGWAVRLRRGERAVFALLWAVLPVIGVILWTGDNGFVVQAVSLVLAGLLLAAWNRQRAGRWFATITGLVLVAALLFLFLPQLLRVGWVDRLATKASHPGSSHVYYRLAVPELGAELLGRPAEEDAYSWSRYLRNSQQRWQMLLYAAEGAHRPRGYGGASLSHVGMNYPTSMSDCVFATCLMSEHGAMAGFLLLLLYAGMGGVLVFAAAHLPEAAGHRGLVLIAVGAHFALTGLYMAGANLGLLLFTGQNLPLLSLVSSSDLAAGAVLLAAAAYLIRAGLGGEQSAAFAAHPWVRRIALGYLGLLAAGLIVCAGRLVGMARDAGLRQDFKLSDESYRQFAANLPELGKVKPLELGGPRGEDLRIRADEALSWSEKFFVHAFELRSDRYDPAGGYYYLAEPGPRLRINRRYYNLPSPLVPRSPWSGAIEAEGEELPTLSLLGAGVTLRPARTIKARGETVPLAGGGARPATEVSRSLVLSWKKGDASKLVELSYDGAKLVLTRFSSNPEVVFEVHVDGLPWPPSKALAGGEVIRISGHTRARRGAREIPFSYSLIYLGARRPLLAFSVWRNGSLRRVVPAGSLARLADDLGRAFDEGQARKDAAPPDRVVLTLDDSLHRQLERELAAWVPRIYHDGDPPNRRRGISLAVLDAFSGRVLAMPALPLAAPRGQPLAVTGKEPPAPRMARNDNLRNHVIGSTIKPLLFSAVAAGFWPAGVDLGKLEVLHGNDRTAADPPSATHPHHVIAGVALDGSWDCLQRAEGSIDAGTFLVQSRNYFAAVIGLLGTTLDPRDWPRILRGGGPGPGRTLVSYAGVRRVLDLSQAPPEHTSFTFDDPGPPSPKPRELGDSLLFRQMAALFAVEPDLEAGDDPAYGDYLRRAVASFYPTLPGARLEQDSGVEVVLPDLQSLRPGSFHSTFQDFMSFLRGGGTAGRWNNVRLAEAMARIATGTAVTARLTEGGGGSKAPQLPAPLSDETWRLTRLIEPLGDVARKGTANKLLPFVKEAENGGYRLMVKTGTLEERPGARKRYESELLVFVLGKWSGKSFVPGQTVAGVLHLQDSKPVSDHEWVRTEVATKIFHILLQGLSAREARAEPAPAAAPDTARKPGQIAGMVGRPRPSVPARRG